MHEIATEGKADNIVERACKEDYINADTVGIPRWFVMINILRNITVV